MLLGSASGIIVQNLMVFSGVLRTWWLRWGSSGFFPPGGLAKLIGVGLTVTGPGASDGLPLSDWQAEFESSSGISSTVLSLGIPS
jgi:hypothetical protein